MEQTVVRGAAPGSGGDSELLRPYVPRLVIDWMRTTPDALHRELEATVVFVDISGFTALTERLAKKGKIGAELMRDTLDDIFKALLDEAYDWGAGLLKWGGDALLLLFDGPGHEARACRAAWEMQRTIDRVGRLHLSGGSLTLRMSVGIGTGRFHFFMTGSVHRELLIAGPAMSETLQMEAIADAGEIGLSPTLAALPRSLVRRPGERGVVLLAAPPDVARQRAGDVGDVSGLDIPSCIPVAARAHVLLKKSEPEHRTITAAFIDLMDTDRLLEELGPEGLGEALDERIRTHPGSRAALRGAVLRDRCRQVEYQGAPDRRRAVQHRARRGANAPNATRDHGRAGRRPDARRSQHRARSLPATSGRRTDAPTASSATPSTLRPG